MLEDASILQTDCGAITVKCGFTPSPKVSIDGITCEPPMLCYIVSEREQEDDIPADWEGGKYVATCINLKMDGYGATVSEALRDMKTNIREYIDMLLDRYGHTHTTLNNIFRQDLTDQYTKALWDKYVLWVQKHIPIPIYNSARYICVPTAGNYEIYVPVDDINIGKIVDISIASKPYVKKLKPGLIIPTESMTEA
jgi:hypothetical protein